VTRFAHVTGWGMAAPENIMSNDDIAKIVDTNDDWIVARTGIHRRHIAGRDETTASLAALAATRALERTELSASEIDLIIVATASPEHLFPATACIVQDTIGATQAGAFDLSAACTGFIIGLNMAAQAIRTGAIENAIVIGSETLSRLVNWQDRGTCVLFGDGAGAFVLQASERPGGVLSAVMRSDGSGGTLLEVPAGGSKLPASLETVHKNLHTIRMNGREVFRFATRVMAGATRQVIKQAGLTLDDIELVIPHQANERIIESAARSLGLPMERFVVNIGEFGNTSSASIPIAACEALEAGRIRSGDHLVLVAFGAGLTWGAMVLEWVAPEGKVTPSRRRRWLLAALFSRLRSGLRRLGRMIEGLIWGAARPGQSK
jgi:3-oxoacyl-[acyl-carrier-protein] synthase-3